VDTSFFPSSPVAVIIPTRNRAEALEKYSLRSLEGSDFRDFLCIVWDASDDENTRRVVDRSWPFRAHYFKAPRTGLASQRNDAVSHVLTNLPEVRHVVFMDDDSEFSADALSGIMETFQSASDIAIVNIPMKSLTPPSWRSRFRNFAKRRLGMNRHGTTPFLYNYGGEDEAPGLDVEWASGCGMAVDVSIFERDRVFFPEAFQRFGGYSLGEDFAFSFFVSKKLRRRSVNALRGHLRHYAAGSARLDVERMAASKWHNFHLLFEALYDDFAPGSGRLWLRARFELFMCAAALKLLLRARSLDVPSVLRGIAAARAALREFHATGDTDSLMKKQNNET
jgi:glycosyltransferase involved in cell wall biosynthesis